MRPQPWLIHGCGIYCVSATILGPGDKGVNKTGKIVTLMELIFQKVKEEKHWLWRLKP